MATKIEKPTIIEPTGNKPKIIKEFTEYDIMINKSFRDLLCLEGLLISVLTHCSIY